MSLSQEKHASHVVEKAFQVAPELVLCAMMDEIFDGYECDKFVFGICCRFFLFVCDIAMVLRVLVSMLMTRLIWCESIFALSMVFGNL